MPEYTEKRKFGGKVYGYAMYSGQKNEAKAFAKRQRDRGKLARVVPAKTRWGTIYLVFVRREII